MNENLWNDFLLQKKLRSGAPELHRRAQDSVFVLENMLFSFRNRFPGYTDHSLMHSMNVLYYCNLLIGPEQVERMSPEECYVLIMACYLHDTGMGISEEDFAQFAKALPGGPGREPLEDTPDAVRSLHNELSGLFIRKYAELLEIPSQTLLYGVIQVSRGHRKTDLMDPGEYPDLPAEGGALRLAYLAAVLRLADELDVASDRNSELLDELCNPTRRQDIEAHGINESISSVELEEGRILLRVRPKSPEYEALLQEAADKIQETLDYCRDVAVRRSDLRITQERVELLPEGEN